MTVACGPMPGVHSFLLPHRPLLIIANSSSTRLHRPCAGLQPQFRKIAIPLCANAALLCKPAFARRLGAGECQIALDGFLSTSLRAPTYSERHVLRRLALLSLGHPLGVFPAPCGNFAALLFRFLPQEISRANGARLWPESGRYFLRLPSQKAPLALGSRAHSRRVAQGCPE
jgi:hypothetical protein